MPLLCSSTISHATGLRPSAAKPCGASNPAPLLVTLAIVAFLLQASTLPAADWPTARGNPQRTGNVDGLPGPKAPKVLWVYKAAEHYVGAPAPGTTALFVPGIGGFNTGVFHALSQAAQPPDRVLWSKTAPYISRPTVSSPAVVGDLVVFGDGMHQTDDATLYCVHAGSGMPVWRLPVPGRLVHLEAAPTIDRDRVYICGGDAGVMAVELKRVAVDGQDRDLAAVLPDRTARWNEMLARYEQEKKKDPALAVPPGDESLPSIQPKVVWQHGKGAWHIDAPPVVAGDFVLVASAYLDDEKIGRRALICLKAADGSVVWETPLDVNPWAGPTVAGPLVLVGGSNIRFDRKLVGQARGEVLAVELASGKVRWRQDAGGGVLSPIAVRGETAVYATTGGAVVARNAGTGQQLWAYAAGQPFFAGPAIAGDVVYAADLKSTVHAVQLANGAKLWTFDVAADLAVQSRSMPFGSPVVHGGDLYLATCNLDGEADQPSVVVCLSDRAAANAVAASPIVVDRQRRAVAVPCKIAPRKLPTLKEIYPLEVVATYPSPRGQKAHETVVTFECKPSDVHRALESLGLKPGKPARGEGQAAAGPEVRVYLEIPGFGGRPRLVPIEKLLVDTRTGRTMPPLRWHFTGSALRQPDPMKEERVYGADLSGTLLSLVPVTDETVFQTNLTMNEERLVKLDTNKTILPDEGTDVRLIIEVK